MHSVSKRNIDVATARQIVTVAFGAHAAIRRYDDLRDGYFNAAYQIDLADGRRAVLKVAPPPDVRVLRYEQGILGSEVQMLRLVAQHTSVPVPEVYYHDGSHAIIDSEYFLMSFVTGQAYHKVRESYTPQRRAMIEQTIGDYLRQINAIRGSFFGYPTMAGRGYTTWRQAFLGMFEDLLQDGQDKQVVLPLEYGTLRSRVEAVAPALDDVHTPQLVHWDLWDGNVFVEPKTGSVTGLIDFERALWGDPLMEFQYRTLEITPAYESGYRASLLDSPSALARRTLYNLYLYLIMVIECSYRYYETDDQERWARQQLAADQDRLARL
jgi:aminoglycoside phosphotransferase (APT) family kinase protein